jgi:hypothetical protein
VSARGGAKPPRSASEDSEESAAKEPAAATAAAGANGYVVNATATSTAAITTITPGGRGFGRHGRREQSRARDDKLLHFDPHNKHLHAAKELPGQW